MLKRLISGVCIGISTVAVSLTAVTALANDPPKTVPHVDLEKYLGVWNELATIPADFQKKCYSNTSAEYSTGEDGLINVVNRCVTKEGETDLAEGRARPNPDFDQPSKLQVTFVEVLGKWLWLAAGDYWIMDLPADYSYVLIGHPKREYGWILARTTTLPMATFRDLRDKLEALGYDACKFLMSRTDDQKFETRPTLCQFTD